MLILTCLDGILARPSVSCYRKFLAALHELSNLERAQTYKQWKWYENYVGVIENLEKYFMIS